VNRRPTSPKKALRRLHALDWSELEASGQPRIDADARVELFNWVLDEMIDAVTSQFGRVEKLERKQ
jgi:hypothetical protein